MTQAIANRSSKPPQAVGSYTKLAVAYAKIMIFAVGHTLLDIVSISINTAQARFKNYEFTLFLLLIKTVLGGRTMSLVESA